MVSVTVTRSKHAAVGPSYASSAALKTFTTAVALAVACAARCWPASARWRALVGRKGLGLGV